MILAAGRQVLIDTNLLLLLLIGHIDLNQIGTNRRIRKYSLHAYQLLIEYLHDAKSLATTEHINSQTSDLGASSLAGSHRQNFLHLLRAIHDPGSHGVSKAKEYSQPILNLDGAPLHTLGVADAGIINAARQHNCVLLTDDLDLYMMALREGVDATNFSHLL